MDKSQINEEIQHLLKEHASLSLIKESNKVKCYLSGHEMPCNAAVIRQYLCGKKYLKLQTSAGYNYSKYKQFLPASNKRKHENHLFCQLTWHHINNQSSHIERHITGARFQRAYKRWLACQASGEPFKPRGNRQKKRIDGMEEEEEEEDSSGEEEQPEDDMEDLYPAAHFASDNESEASDYEVDNMDTSDIQQEPAQNEQSKTVKRPADVATDVPRKKSKKSRSKTMPAKAKLKKN